MIVQVANIEKSDDGQVANKVEGISHLRDERAAGGGRIPRGGEHPVPVLVAHISLIFNEIFEYLLRIFNIKKICNLLYSLPTYELPSQANMATTSLCALSLGSRAKGSL